MSAITSAPGAPSLASPSLKILAWREAQRYARHPLFLVGALLAAFLIIGEARRDQPDGVPADAGFYVMFCFGLFGTVVGYRLAKSFDTAREVADVAPVPPTTRTAALCLATLVPAAAGALTLAGYYAVTLARWHDEPAYNNGMSGLTVICAALSAVVACAGGPLFGILVARWTNFPGAGLLAVVVLIAWSIGGTSGLTIDQPSRVSALLILQAPARGWASADGPHTQLWQVEGWPVAHLAYVVALCLLGATLAILRDAEGDQRRRLWRAAAALVVVALLALGAGILPDPMRVPLDTWAL